MRKGLIFAALFFVVGLGLIFGTAHAAEKYDGKVVIQKLLARIESLQKEVAHLRVIVTATVKKDSVSDEVKIALVGFPEQLEMMTSGLQSLKTQIQGNPMTSDDAFLRGYSERLSVLIASLEDALLEMRKSLQGLSGSYAS